MSEPLRRVVAVAATELKFRFRRTAAVITMLIIAAGVYFIVPDLSTGRTLLQINNARVLYTSPAVALGTGMFCALFMSVAGFYLVSNSYRRDILTRTGILVAAAPVTNTEYVLGKFLGNSLYLGTLTLTCMVSSMLMFLLRGEAGLEIGTFLAVYAWLMLPTIAFSAAIALAFEGAPVLSGRFGDVLFFFVWGGLLGFPAAMMENAAKPEWLSGLDIVGIVPVIEFLQKHFHTMAMSIGSSTFDPSRVPVLLDSLPMSPGYLLQRASAFLLPCVLLLAARWWFHRFNPARVRFSSRQARRSLLGRINGLLKPATRFLQFFAAGNAPRKGSPSLAQAVRADVLATLALSPVILAAIAVFAIISLSVDSEALRAGVVPAIAVAVIVSLADVATRDHAAGTPALLFTSPHLRRHYVLWKLLSALIITLSFTLIPLARLLFAFPVAALSLLIGSVFTASAATGLGIMTNSGKPFTGLFLMLLYIALNAKGEPTVDFMGMYGTATPDVQIGYALLSAGLVFGGVLRHRSRLND